MSMFITRSLYKSGIRIPFIPKHNQLQPTKLTNTAFYDLKLRSLSLSIVCTLWIAYELVPRLNQRSYTHNYQLVVRLHIELERWTRGISTVQLTTISTDAPARIRESTMDPRPLLEAHIRAVLPYSFCISNDAPARIRESTMDSCPLSEAHIRAV